MRFGTYTGLLLLGLSTVSTPQPAHAADRGHELFREKGCVQCHVYDGEGGSKGPALDGVGKRLSKTAIENQIRNGSLVMPAFADALTADEITAIAAFLHKSTKPSTALHSR
ncbi:MAG: c-type cytochrome [Janthinobacterium lividum]